ncbi:MAG: beta-lactamase family protein [Gemmatimonadetes bacterium]|nr:beta-lactamase family protein [Gemmatimonadota bacterium]
MMGRYGPRVAFLVLLAALSWQAPLAAQQGWDSHLDTFAAELAEGVGIDSVGGLVAGVAIDGDLVWAAAFGWADRDRLLPMETSSVSRTGSISKSVTAVLMMRLVDEGVIALDESVEDHLPELEGLKDKRPGAPAVTFRHLASHTAGLVREPDWQESVVGPIDQWDERILQSIPRTAYDSIPGARYQYSNIGFGMLGLALSRAAGRPFMEMVEHEVFAPLGMTGSAFVVVGDELEQRLAAGYTVRSGVVSGEQPAREHAGRGYKVPNGGVYSTVADLARFLGAVSGVPGLQILSEESRREMIRVQTPEDPADGYGLGFRVTVDDQGRRIVSHGGSVAGYNAHMAVDPDAGISVILLRNYGGGEIDLGRAAQDLLRGLRELPRR